MLFFPLKWTYLWLYLSYLFHLKSCQLFCTSVLVLAGVELTFFTDFLPLFQCVVQLKEGWEETQVTQTDQRDISDHMSPCLIYKVGGRRRRKGETFGAMEFVFLSHHHLWWGPAAYGKDWINDCIPCFALLVWASFAFPIKLLLSQPMSFPAFTFLILFPIQLVQEWVSSCVGLGYWLR